jgi:hypothetical protein
MWLVQRQAHDYWEDPPGRRRCVSLPRLRPLGRWGTLPSFLPLAAEIPKDPSNRPPTRLADRVQPTRSSMRETGSRPELGEPVVIEPTHITMAPHRTVPKGRGPRLSCHVKADMRYGPGCLSRHMWFSDLKTLPPHTSHYLRSRHPGPGSTWCLGTRHRAPRDPSGDRP